MKEKNNFIRLPEVLERTGFCKAWIYRLISRNEFPSPIKIGDRAIGFVESEIDAWIDEKIYFSRNKVLSVHITSTSHIMNYFKYKFSLI